MRKYFGPIALLAAALVPLSGCVVFGTLDAKGGVFMTIKVRMVSVAGFEGVKLGLRSDHVKVTDASMTPNKWATFEVVCDDVRQLTSAPIFSRQSVTVSEPDANGEKTLAIGLRNGNPQKWSRELQTYFNKELKISLEVPGEVTRSNATVQSGRHVTWTWPLDDIPTRSQADLTATFKKPES